MISTIKRNTNHTLNKAGHLSFARLEVQRASRWICLPRFDLWFHIPNIDIDESIIISSNHQRSNRIKKTHFGQFSCQFKSSISKQLIHNHFIQYSLIKCSFTKWSLKIKIESLQRWMSEFELNNQQPIAIENEQRKELLYQWICQIWSMKKTILWTLKPTCWIISINQSIQSNPIQSQSNPNPIQIFDWILTVWQYHLN